MKFRAFQVVDAAWIVWLFYWLLAARRVNKMREHEPIWRRFVLLLLIAIGVWALWSPKPGGFIHRHFTHAAEIRWVGVALTIGGIAFAICARRHLGVYWSGVVGLREGHQLIRSGPYARIRHPIYTGILLAAFGSALAVETYGALSLFVILTLGLSFKAKREEKLLAREFGPAFEEHRQRTGFLLPKFFRA